MPVYTRFSAHPCLADLPKVSATELKNAIAEVFDQVAAKGAVAITRHQKPRAVLLSVEQFEEILRARNEPLDQLGAEFDALLARMQTPEARKGMESAFEATPDRLGQAAVSRARRQA